MDCSTQRDAGNRRLRKLLGENIVQDGVLVRVDDRDEHCQQGKLMVRRKLESANIGAVKWCY